jgi:MFS superfamily sulfate permease-like transporter
MKTLLLIAIIIAVFVIGFRFGVYVGVVTSFTLLKKKMEELGVMKDERLD